MNNEKIVNILPISRQNSTPSPSNYNTASRPEFTRTMNLMHQSNISTLPAPSIPLQTANNSRTVHVSPEFASSGRSNVSNQLRYALINNGPAYNYKTMKKDFLDGTEAAPQRHTMHSIRNEFMFGMSENGRANFFRIAKNDIRKGYATNHYISNEFTNPDAITELRGQALKWSKIQGNNIFSINTNDADIKAFLRELTSEIPKEYRQAASAMIDQPHGYRQALPGTIAAELANLQLLQGHVSSAASNQAPSGAQAQQDAYSPDASAASSPETVSEPSTVGKRSYWTINTEPTSYHNGSPTFKRSRPDDASQVFPSSASQSPQSASTPSTPNAMSQSSGTSVQQQPQPQPQQYQQLPLLPQTQPTYNSGATNYQPHLFQGQSLATSQQQMRSQQLSSWSASNGMSQSAAQQEQPLLPQPYNSANMNHQTNVFQGGQFFSSSAALPMLQMQGTNPQPQNLQSSQFNQGNLPQGSNMSGALTIGQPNYDASGASTPSSPVFTSDEEWNNLVQILDKLAPTMPATQTQLTPVLPVPLGFSTLPVTAALTQATSTPSTAMPTQQPATTG